MSVVLRGMGLGDIDSGSTVVAFGLARDLEEGEEISEVLANAGIEQLFVIDYGYPDPRGMTESEYHRFKVLMRMLMMGSVQFHEKTKNGVKGIEYFVVRPPVIRKLAA